MFEAQRLSVGDSVFSPWFGRGGDILIATADIVAWSAAATTTLTITVFTKNQETTGEGTDADGTPSKSIVVDSGGTPDIGRYDEEWDGEALSPGLLELVRYKFVVTGTAGNGDSVLFRMLAPVWADAVKA